MARCLHRFFIRSAVVGRSRIDATRKMMNGITATIFTSIARVRTAVTSRGRASYHAVRAAMAASANRASACPPATIRVITSGLRPITAAAKQAWAGPCRRPSLAAKTTVAIQHNPASALNAVTVAAADRKAQTSAADISVKPGP
jgi:hypothetical protein